MDTHATPRGLLAVGVEFRQDRIEFAAGARLWAERFGDALESSPALSASAPDSRPPEAMSAARDFTLGIEEEYLLVDRASRDLIREAPKTMLARCESLLGSSVTTEFLQSQIEVGTRVCADIGEAREHLALLRRTVASCAADEGLALTAASTHPFAQWVEQKQTEKERYQGLARDMQGVSRRMMICGMHVHVCIVDQDLRLDLMNQVAYFVPHLLALSTSSPFWTGIGTGLASYRVAVFDNMPRTGLPNAFAKLVGVPAPCRRAGSCRGDGGLVDDMVGRPPVGAVSDHGDADMRCLHAVR